MKTKLFGNIDGNEWEKICQRILRMRFRENGYSEVPSKYGGDLGIEGFTLNGILFQCYVPEEPDFEKSIYSAQVKKITTDVGKLIKNIKKIRELNGESIIREWHFLTPNYDNKDLLKHCRKKEKEVILALNNYVNQDFKILIKTEDDYIEETQVLFNIGLNKIPYNESLVAKDEFEDLLNSSNDIINKIKEKIEKIPSISIDSTKVNLLVRNIFLQYTLGQAHLDHLKNIHPNHYSKLLRLKDSIEKSVERESLTFSGNGGDLLRNVQNKYSDQICSVFQNSFELSLIECLANEAISDWLVRCPLDF